MAILIANTQVYEKLLLSTLMAYRHSRFPTTNRLHALTTLCRLPLYLFHELAERQIRDFLSPETFHSLEIQVLKEADIKLWDEFECQFLAVILTLAGYLAMHSRIVFTRSFAIITATLLCRQLRIRSFDFIGRLFVELWQVVFRAIRTRQEILAPEVEPCSITRLGFGVETFLVCCSGEIPITECVSFDGYALESPLYFTRIPELIPTSIDTNFRNRHTSFLACFARNFFYFDAAARKRH